MEHDGVYMNTFLKAVLVAGAVGFTTSQFFGSMGVANAMPGPGSTLGPGAMTPPMTQPVKKPLGTVTITGLEYDDTVTSYTDPTQEVARTDSEAVSTITQVTYSIDGQEYTVDVDEATEDAVFTVDGIQYDLLDSYRDGTEYDYYQPDGVQITLTQKGDSESGSACIKFYQGVTQPFSITYYTRAAAWITADGLQEDYSATPALVGGTTGDSSSQDVSITSKGSFFSGYYINGATYSISDLTMSLLGYGGDDFQGWGAGIMATGGGDVTIDDAVIDTTGVIRTAIWVGGDGTKADITDTVVEAYNDDDATPYSDDDYYAVPMMEIVPFALGLVGNIRATNVLGSAEASYSDSIIVSNSWGALSTDSGTSYTHALDVQNVLSGIGEVEVAQPGKHYTAEKMVNGVEYGFTIATLGERSGYVTYADSGVYDTFDNVTFYAPDYLGIVASNSSLIYMKDSYGYTDRIGFMIHKNTGAENSGFAEEDTGFSDKGGVYIDGGKYDVADTFILVKSGSTTASPNVEIDGADITIHGTHDYSGALLRLMETDDAGSPGVTEYTIDDLDSDEYAALTESTSTIDDTTATFSNMTVTGDIYNSIYTAYQQLDVTLDHMTLTGIISSAMQTHVDADGSTDDVEGKTIYATNDDDYLYVGRVVSTPATTINNPIALTLTNGTTWNVTGESYLSSLTVENGSFINGYVTVDGEPVTLEAGTTYSDAEIIVYPLPAKPAQPTPKPQSAPKLQPTPKAQPVSNMQGQGYPSNQNTQPGRTI